MIDLTPQQIKDNAPEGATHYGGVNKIGYFKKSGFKWSIYLSGSEKWWSDYKDCHSIYWFFGWWYSHKFINPDIKHEIKPL